jgi:hypothetical protein
MEDQSSVLYAPEIKPEVWFVNRQLDFKPLHFITAKTRLTNESAKWILTSLTGRFSFSGHYEVDDFFDHVILPSFEDPGEAVMYELKWS